MIEFQNHFNKHFGEHFEGTVTLNSPFSQFCATWITSVVLVSITCSLELSSGEKKKASFENEADSEGWGEHVHFSINSPNSNISRGTASVVFPID